MSVAETGHQDLWQRAEIACAVVGTARPVVEETLRAADRTVEETDGVRIVDTVTAVPMKGRPRRPSRWPRPSAR